MSDNNEVEDNKLASAQHLLQEFEDDMYHVYQQMQKLEIVFSNLKG